MERRETRFKGINPNDARLYWKMTSEIYLRNKHTVQEEINAWRTFCHGCEYLCLANKDSIFYSTHASFLKKLVIFKDTKQYRKDNFRSWPEGSFCTPTSAVTQIRNYMKSFDDNVTKPLTLFIGQSDGIEVKSYEHCWILLVWKIDGAYKMLVKDCNTYNQGAHVSSFSIAIAKLLNVDKVYLEEANSADINSNEGCVLRALHFVADALDGHWTINYRYDKLPYYDISLKTHVGL